MLTDPSVAYRTDPTWLDVQPGERCSLSTNCGLSVYRHAPSRPAGIRVPLVCAQDHPRSTRPAEQPILAIARRQHRKRTEPLLADVTASAEYDKEAADLSDEKLRKAAGLLNLDDLAESADLRFSRDCPGSRRAEDRAATI